MYYPGLFENTNPYSALTPIPFKSEILPSSTELCLLENKKMVSSLSNSSACPPPLSGSKLPFRTSHFSPPSSRFQPQNGDDLVSSPYSSASTAAHLSPNSLASPNLSQKSLLDGSTPYSIGPLSTYQPYSTQYLNNSVMSTALKPPNGSPYTSPNTYYPSSAQPYPSLYPESFISDYITRNQIDANNSSYTAPQDNSSFLEHLKRLQESFQSKSGKLAGNTNAARPSTSSHSNEAVNISDSISAKTNVSGPKSNLTSARDSSSAQVASSHGPPQRNDDECDSIGASLHHRKATHSCQRKSVTNSDSHAETDSSQQQLRDIYSVTTKGSSSLTKEQSRAPTLAPTAEVPAKSRKSSSAKSTSLTKSKSSEDATNRSPPKSKHKSSKQKRSVKRNRSDECDRSEQTGHNKKTKRRCKQHPESTGKTLEQKPKANEIAKEVIRMPRSKKAKQNTAPATGNNENTEETPKENHKTTKKSSGSVRRRRFRSGLDMIRSSRKRTKLSSAAKKDGSKKEATKKESTTKDLRAESKRLIVNKSLGETLLHRSARNNRIDVVRFCLESDACEVNARDNAGYTPLHECSSRGNLQVARLLLEHSADVNASATGGIRPLHDAIENNHIEMVRLLLSYGAEPHISTYSGSTPLQLCRSKAMFKFLKGFYSDITTDRPVIDSSTLAWKLRSEPSGLDNGFDILADAPSDDEHCEQVLYVSAEPILPSYTLIHKSDSPFYLLCDVLDATALSEAEFCLKYPHVEVSQINKSDLVRSSLSQIQQAHCPQLDGEGELSVIHQSDSIHDILHISSTVIM